MKKRFSTAILLFSILLTLSACSNETYDETHIFAMDTVISIKIAKDSANRGYFEKCRQIIEEVEQRFSKTVDTSEVTSFNQSKTGLSSPSDELISLIEPALNISAQTGGAFDITVEPLVSLWDITGENPAVPAQDEIASLLQHVGYEKITLTDTALNKAETGVQIDLGGIAKGYALGEIVSYLSGQGVAYGTVSFGGNIGVIGTKPDGSRWNIGIKDPESTQGQIGAVSIETGYIAVSGDYERYFEYNGKRYHHILDPKTGYPADTGIHSAAVICQDPVLADALSTALFVMGIDKAMQFYTDGLYKFEAVFVTENGILCTDGIKEYFTPKKG